MEIRISQRQENGSMKTIIIDGEIDALGIEPEEIPQFLLACEMIINATGDIRVWFYGYPL